MPLLSNLTLQENIALMLEVHQGMEVKQAERNAVSYLEQLCDEDIAHKRVAASSEQDLFYAKFLRALLSPFPEIIIVMPKLLIGGQHIQAVICELQQKLKATKPITLLDLEVNQNAYKDEMCAIST